VDAPLPQSPEEMRREIQQLRKELARVTTQRDILKKVTGILSEN
jgi:transposase-like protein